MVDFGKNDMMPHFIYCYGTYFYFDYGNFKKLKEIILKKMREYGISSSILTTLRMSRMNLITKEKSKEAAERKLNNDPEWERYKGSINDDLESFLNNLQNSNEIDYEDVESFFTPKLTEEELKLVEQKNEEHMRTYVSSYSPDVDVEEMKKSDSKDKYLHSRCRRRTTYLSLESEHISSENSSDHSFEDLYVLSDVSSDAQSTTEWAAGWDAALVAGRMGDGMSHQPDDSSNHLRSPTRKRIRK